MYMIESFVAFELENLTRKINIKIDHNYLCFASNLNVVVRVGIKPRPPGQVEIAILTN